MFFFRKKSVARVAKAYFQADPQAPIDFAFLCNEVITLAGSHAATLEWNHGRPEAYEAGKLIGINGTHAALKSCRLTDEQGDLVFMLAHWPIPEQAGRSMFELIIRMDGPVDDHGFERETKLFDQLAKRVDLVYGYSRTLRSDHDIFKETARRDRYGKSILVVNYINTWMFHPGELAAGGIRGIYPFNFWGKNVAPRLQERGMTLPPQCTQSSGLVMFNKEEQEQIARDNPGSKRFIRFGSTE